MEVWGSAVKWVMMNAMLHLRLPNLFSRSLTFAYFCICLLSLFYASLLASVSIQQKWPAGSRPQDISQQSVTRIINLSASVLVFHFPIVVAVACLQNATLDTTTKIMLRVSCIVWLVNGTMVRYFLLSPPALQHHYALLTPTPIPILTHASFTVCACVARYLSSKLMCCLWRLWQKWDCSRYVNTDAAAEQISWSCHRSSVTT